MARMTNGFTHVTRGDVLDDLGFTRSEATALKVKADLLDAIRVEIDRRSYTQRQLVSILDEHQPAVSNLMRGRITQVSIEKLLRYLDRLGMRAQLKVLPARRAARAA
jgi:predicted XRE-type DNA-binding protein